MTSNPETELVEARKRLLQFADEYDVAPEISTLNEIWQRAQEIGKSASGSWLGYQANVYFKDFKVPPAGAYFDIEHGTGGTYFSEPNPDWVEQTAQDVFNLLLDANGGTALAAAEQAAEKGLALLNGVKADVSSVLTVYISDHDDSFVRRLADEIEQAKVLDAADIANEMSPKTQLITSDMRAVQQGTCAPPHIKVQARVTAAHQPAAHCRDLAERLGKLAAHLARIKQREVRAARIGTNIFVSFRQCCVKSLRWAGTLVGP